MKYYNMYLYQTARVLAIVILGQTLFFKYSGADESVFIFQTLGMEPWGRYLTAVFESIAIVLIVFPKYVWLGAGIAINLMFGAILSHFVFLGIVVQDDGGLLFGLAFLVLLASLYLVYCDFLKIPFIERRSSAR
ncbi:MAG: DoxX family protein [Leptospira sp.]|nr:DoxX family protein [Leptospira sp.]